MDLEPGRVAEAKVASDWSAIAAPQLALNLLYGFPARITDDFVHPVQYLRIGADIDFGGNVEPVFRRGGRVSSLPHAQD